MSFLDYLCATSVIQAALALPGDKSGASLGGFPALERLVSGLDEDEAARWRKIRRIFARCVFGCCAVFQGRIPPVRRHFPLR